MKLFRVASKLIVTGAILTLGKALIDTIENSLEEDVISIDEKIKNTQCELARLYDIVILNEKRESTKQVENITITINGVEINQAIIQLEKELNNLLKSKNK